MTTATRISVRIVAIAGALFIFGAVFLVVDFVAMKMMDGMSDQAAVLGTIAANFIALLPAVSSYRASVSRGRRSVAM